MYMRTNTLNLSYYLTGSSSRFIIRPLEGLVVLELDQALNIQYEVNIFCVRVCPTGGVCGSSGKLNVLARIVM